MRSLPLLALSLVGLAITPASWAENDKGHGHGHGKGPEVALAPSGRIVVSDHHRLFERVSRRQLPGRADAHRQGLRVQAAVGARRAARLSGADRGAAPATARRARATAG